NTTTPVACKRQVPSSGNRRERVARRLHILRHEEPGTALNLRLRAVFAALRVCATRKKPPNGRYRTQERRPERTESPVSGGRQPPSRGVPARPEQVRSPNPSGGGLDVLAKKIQSGRFLMALAGLVTLAGTAWGQEEAVCDTG